METIVFVCCGITWLFAIVTLCSRRDVEIHDKLSWVVAILILNVVGALLYFFFGPKPAPDPMEKAFVFDPDAKPIIPDDMSWNVFVGANHFPAGEGLNPKSDDDPKSE